MFYDVSWGRQLLLLLLLWKEILCFPEHDCTGVEGHTYFNNTCVCKKNEHISRIEITFTVWTRLVMKKQGPVAGLITSYPFDMVIYSVFCCY